MLSEAEKVACLEVLYRGLLAIRAAAGAGESARAELIADALHNLPHCIAGTLSERTIPEFRAAFLGRVAHLARVQGDRELDLLLEPLRDFE